MDVNEKSTHAAYFDVLNRRTGCTEYIFSPTPLTLEANLFNNINDTVHSLLDVIDSPEYFEHCLNKVEWSLPISEMKSTDYTGCADFLLLEYGAKLIEMNINLPGKIGLMQPLGDSAKSYLDPNETGWTNLNFDRTLVEVIRKALPEAKNIGILFSHLPSSKEHRAHYNYFEKQLHQAGLPVQLIPANELVPTGKGCTYDGQSFDAFINLVIPFVWEANPDEFENLTEVLNRFPNRIFPNPTGGMLGTKDLLSYLSSQRDSTKDWFDFVLSAYPLNAFSSTSELIDKLSDQLVLKPLKDYDAKGVHVLPDTKTLETIFSSKRDVYMVQEFTESLQLPIEIMEEKRKSHSVILRVYFADKKCFGYQGYYVLDDILNSYASSPVKVSHFQEVLK